MAYSVNMIQISGNATNKMVHTIVIQLLPKIVSLHTAHSLLST